MDLFTFFFKFHKKCKERVESPISYKKRAMWAILEGFSRAGIYLSSPS